MFRPGGPEDPESAVYLRAIIEAEEEGDTETATYLRARMDAEDFARNDPAGRMKDSMAIALACLFVLAAAIFGLTYH